MAGKSLSGAKNCFKPRVDVLTLLRLRAHLKQQAAEHCAAVRVGKEDPEEIIEESFITNATHDLERDLQKIKVSFQNKALVLQRIQIVDALRNNMEEKNTDLQVIIGTLKRIVMLSRTIIECHQQVHEKEQKLIDLKKRRLSLKKVGEEKLLQIFTLRKKLKEKRENKAVSSTLEKMHDKLQREIHVTTILQTVFQNIIIASRVNWAEDPSLKAVVMKLEKNVCLL